MFYCTGRTRKSTKVQYTFSILTSQFGIHSQHVMHKHVSYFRTLYNRTVSSGSEYPKLISIRQFLSEMYTSQYFF